MKKGIAFLLSCLTVLFLSLPASGAVFADVPVPEEPKLTSDKVFYQSFNTGNDANDGLTKETAVKTWGDASGLLGVYPLLAGEGGKVIVVTKSYIGDDGYTIPAIGGKTVLFTARDVDGTSYIGDLSNTEAGEYGYIMIRLASQANIEGNLILQDIGLLDRTPSGRDHASVFCVKNGGKLVVGEGVVIRGRSGDYYPAPALCVEEGGVAFLHSAGFSKYTGNGTLVADRALVESGVVNLEQFLEFEGVAIDTTGKALFGDAPITPVETKEPETEPPETSAPDTTATETKAPDTTAPGTKAPETKAPETKAATVTEATGTNATTTTGETKGGIPAYVWVIIGVVAVAAVACGVILATKKKKA